MGSKCISNLAQSRPPSASPNSLHHSLQWHLQTRSITAFKCISRLTRLRSTSSHGQGFQVHLQTCSITASTFTLFWFFKCVPKLAQSQPCSASPDSPDHSLEVYLWCHSLRASKITWWHPPSASWNWLYYSLQMYLQTGTITASKFAQSRPPYVSPNSLNQGLGVHLQTRSITVWRNAGSRSQTFYDQHSATPHMASGGNSWERAILPRDVYKGSVRIWKVSRHDEPHKLLRSI